MKTYRIEALGGDEITSTIEKAIGIAAIRDFEVQFNFNDVEVCARGDSNADLLYRDWSRAMAGSHDGAVGPYPPADLSVEQLARDEEVRIANENRLTESRQNYQREQDAKAAQCDAEIGSIPIDLADAAEWQKCKDANQDGYGGACVSFAERWARLMQVRMARGATVAEVAKQASSDADVEGITGFMYGCAVSMLSACWVHGDALRRWHNIDTQIGTEGERANEDGGVLNPALLNIG